MLNKISAKNSGLTGKKKAAAIAAVVLVLMAIMASAAKKGDEIPAVNTATSVQSQSVQNDVNNPFYNYRHSTKSSYWRMMAAVLIVCGLAYGICWLAKKLKYRSGANAEASIEVLETVYLANRKTLHLVRCGGKTILIGAANDSMTMLADVSSDFKFPEPQENG